MGRGVSLHVGINRVGVSAFAAQHLIGCENDAIAMSNIALSRGFTEVKVLLGPEATFKNVDEELRRAASVLKPGDIFLFTFAGHGSRRPNPNSDETLSAEPDGKDETIVLFNRLLIDDYMRRVVWPEFKEGVRIVGVLDSCHSATAVFAMPDVSLDIAELHSSVAISDESGVVTRAVSISTVEVVTHGPSLSAAEILPPDAPYTIPEEDEAVVSVSFQSRDRAITFVARRNHINGFKPFYDELNIPSLKDAPPVKADLLILAACKDDETTQDGSPNGAFTTALLKVWKNGAFVGSYVEFTDEIRAEIRSRFPTQFPTLTPENPPAFSSEQPFSI